MAFSFRKIISNITNFSKPEEAAKGVNEPNYNYEIIHTSADINENDKKLINLEHSEADSTNKTLGITQQVPEPLINFAANSCSLTDSDIFSENIDTVVNKQKRKSKKLKVDLLKANQSDSSEECVESNNIENTPKHILLECKSSDVYNERLKVFDFNRSFHFDESYISDEREVSDNEDKMDIESLSEESDTSTLSSDDKCIKMCRKVKGQNNAVIMPSTSMESFADVELDKNEEQRMSILLSYQIKLDKMESLLKKLLLEFQFHIEVSKVFNSKSLVSSSTNDASNIPKILKNVNDIEQITRVESPESWNLVIENEDIEMKNKIKTQLLAIKSVIEEFTALYLLDSESSKSKNSTFFVKNRSIAYKQQKNTHKKKLKHFDFPDYRDAMIYLFNTEDEVNNNEEKFNGHPLDNCKCCCHSTPSETDSGLTDKIDHSLSNQSISSSIGNFTLDSTTLSAYSESLDQIISYNSFEDSSLYCTMLKKPAIERITFYVQVHSIQISAEEAEEDDENRNAIVFYCTSCKARETEENGLLKHILSQKHCEKIHFIYKTTYIKRCVATGQEIQPSTVLNPMTVYRDDNKIVCFGDTKYACSLCFESMIVGESMLMAHCSESEHIDRRLRMCDILD